MIYKRLCGCEEAELCNTRIKRVDMDLTKQELLNILKCSSSTLCLYLSRPEFSNIIRKKREGLRRNNIYYSNITEKNIKRFKELLNRKKGNYYV